VAENEANPQRAAYRALTNEQRGALEAAMEDIVDDPGGRRRGGFVNLAEARLSGAAERVPLLMSVLRSVRIAPN
jgi:hypothetical protein